MDIDAAVAEWNDAGVVVLPAFLDGTDLAGAVAELPTMFPTGPEFHQQIDEERNERFRDEFAGIDSFPFAGSALSVLSVHPKLISLARSLLRVDDLRVYSIEAWAKYTGAADYEQPLHRDYLNHTLLVPSDDPRFRQVEMFVYLVDVPAELGAPAFVAQAVTPDVPALPNWYPRVDTEPDADNPAWTSTAGRPDLYDAEMVASGPAGTVVAYTTSTFHRGRQLTEPEGARFTIHVNFRPAQADWAARRSWVEESLDPNWQTFLAAASPDQLSLFGFPPPGHPYWSEQTLAGVALRYPRLDLAPWRLALR
ncbi:MAG: phytanoyl-CoA dioxygenase family protein [Ilumatobacteraceae bacterium]